MIKRFYILLLAIVASVGLSWAGVAVDGRLPGEFSIAKNKKVYFSQGNLQYNKSTNKWSFMTNQYDMVETSEQEVGTNYANQNIVSLFCWGNGNNPTGTSESNKQKFTDYGINPISNGGNVANIWRTLSEAEWVYMLNQYDRSDFRQGTRFAKAKLFGTTYGLIIFPDGYSHPSGVAAVTGVNKTDGTSWNANQYNATDWAKMEAAGCVFLPAAGFRLGTRARYVNTEAAYWTSTPVDNTFSKYECFNQNSFVSISKEDRNGYGMSVRLVLDNATYKVTYKCTDKTSGTVPSDATSYLKGSSVTVKGAGDLAKTGYIFAGWTNGTTTYTEGNTFNITANTTLTAQWNLDMAPVNNVIALINAIGTVTYPGSGDKITAAREAYDALTVQAQKDAVTNYATLTDAEAAYLALQPDVVAGKIDAIGEVAYTAECKAKIDEARAAYDALPPATQAQVGNYAKLQAAEATYAQLLAQAVAAVKAAIDALPATPLTDATKKLSEYNKVKAARAAYDALTDEEKAAVTNYDKLTAAEAAFAAISGGDAGALGGKFSIDESNVVYFSKGNLQATTTDLGANWTWSFAANQWNTIGNAVANTTISGNGTVSENGTVDLFGWSTTANYYGINNSTNENDYSGDFVDWGATMGAGWRTLTCDEWRYILQTRTMQSSAIRYVNSTVNNITGLIILPDDWDESYYTLTGRYFDDNIISAADWTDKLEAHGAVFLPVTGFRSETNWQPDEAGHYSTPTPESMSGFIKHMNFNEYGVSTSGVMSVSDGLSVRLVTAGGASPIADAQAVKDLIDAIGEVSYPDSKEAIKAAREALDALSDEAKALFAEADTAALPAAEATYAGLLAEKVAPVIAAINAVPATPLTDATKKLSEYNKVTDARALYDALTDEEKAAVTNYDKLTAAEAAFAPYAGSGDAPDGSLSGKFTINADGDQIAFSKGNLQYQASTTTLRFATNQYDTIGADNINISDTYTGWIDLFGWGTGNHPALSSTVDEDYSTFTDWGTNAISNGGNEANLWRTMTIQEWNYLIKNRTNAANLQGQATVADVHGYVLLPDSWTLPAGLSFTASPNDWTTNVYTAEQWAQMEAAGAVFLPATGYRDPEIKGVGTRGEYWSSNVLSDLAAYCFEFNETTSRVFGSRIYFGHPVRLVAEGGASPIADAQSAKDLIDAIPSPVVYTPECKEAIKAAREALDALSDEAKALFNEADTAALPAAETAYAGLLAEKVAPVIAAINAVPATPLTDATKKLSEYNKVTDARALYDALATDEEKAAVTNYDKLTAAEAAFAAISGGGSAGALSGKFSINADGDQIAFSKGNLQATTTDLGEHWTWGFAAHQYDFIGDAAANNAINGDKSVSANGSVDIFGWSTEATYYGIHNSEDNATYSGDFKDWGSNIGEGWRTLSSAEWIYLLKTRTDASSKFGMATVADVHGMIVLPDNYAGAAINSARDAWDNNIISASDWATYEAAGVVFLPAGGNREGKYVYLVGSNGHYWSSTNYDEEKANSIYFGSDFYKADGIFSRKYSHSVRLVTANEGSSPIAAAQAAVDLINAIPSPVAYDAASKNAIDAARAAVDALGANASLIDDADLQKLTDAEDAYAQLLAQAVKAVKDQIDALPATPLQDADKKLSEYNKVKAARAAYDALLNADDKALVTNLAKLEAAEEAFAAISGGGAPAGALNGAFTINADGDQISFAKGNLQATTTDLGANWTWGFAANQWDNIWIDVANNKINGNGTVSENGTVDLFGWSTNATYFGINNSYKSADYPGEFVDWGTNIGTGWRTLTKAEWDYLIEHSTKGRAAVNGKNGYIFLPNEWSGPAFTANPDDFTTNTYDGDDWTAMENAGAVFLPYSPTRNGTSALIAMNVKYWSSTSIDDNNSYVFTFYTDQSQSDCTSNNRAYGCMVRLVTEGTIPSPLDSAQAVKDLIDAIPQPVVYTPECKEAIKAAREALDALSDEAKALFNEADTAALPAAEATYAGLLAEKVAPVIAAINAVPATPLTDATKKLSEYNKVTDARALYDALTDEEKAAVTNYDKLTAAEAAFAAIPSVGSETVITWDKNTGIEKISGTTTSPAYEGITISIKGGGFSPENDMLRFNIAGLGLSFEFANTLGGNFQKIVISSTNAMPSTPLAGMGEGWAASNENKTATWTGDAATVKIWDGLTATSYWDVNTIQFTLGATVSATEAAQAAKDLIDAIPTPAELTPECLNAVKAAREAVDALGEAASLIDDADMQKLTDAEAVVGDALNVWISGDCDVILWSDSTMTVKKHAGEGNGAMADYTDYYGDNTAPWFNHNWYNPQPGDIVIKSITIEEGVTRIGENAFGWINDLKTVTIPASMATIGEDAFYWSKAVDDIYLTVADTANLTWALPNSVDVQFKPSKATLCHVPADLLTAYQEKFGTLNVTFVGDLDPITPLTPEQQQALDAVKGLINAIPSPVVYTPACKDAIDAARAAYDALTPDMLKQLVSNYATLTAAETTYANLKDVAVVEAKINAIPQSVTLKLATRDSIQNARAAYDALTADQKLLVSNYDVLTAAEATWAKLINVAPAGALSGKYTINDGGDVIYFAHGNLQYTRENLLDADWSTGTFRLATNQYDLIELDKTYPAAYCTDNYGDKTAVGLFGWGTWGEGKTPNLTSSDRTLYTWSTDFSGTLEGTDTWRTLSKDEWVYLLAHNNQSYATVHGVNGLLVAPDGKDIDGKSMTAWVEINDETWTTMQNDGYLFLPACGQRSQMSSTANITTGDQGEEVLYYSSTQYSDVYAYNIWYKPGQDPAAADYSNKRQAFGVRLVSAGVNPLDQAQAVKDLIDAIPVPVTLDDACVNAIQAAREALDALGENASLLDDADLQKLADAEQALKDLNQAEANKVIAKINNIPQPVELKLATRDSIQNARAAYDALNEAQQALVTNYQKLLDAEAALAEKNKGGSASVDIVWDKNTGIANVDPNTTSPAYDGITITTGNGNRFYQTTTDPNMLRFFFTGGKGSYAFAQEDGTHFTKVALISSVAMGEWLREPSRIGTDWVVSDDYKKATWTGDADTVKIWDGAGATAWVDVDSIVFTVIGTATPLDSAQAVKDLIDAIPTPVEYPTSGPAIAAALVAYNQLSDAAKGALDAADVQKMTDAATQYAALDAIAAIDAIPAEIVYDPAVKAAIENAREKYDALTDASKALVGTEVLQKLTDAEAAWAILVAKIEHNVTYIGKDGNLKTETVALLHIPDPAPDFNGYEFVRWDVKAGDFLEEGLSIKAVYTPIITTNPVAFDTLVYNGTAQTLIEAGVAKEGHIEYRLNDGEWSTELPKADMAAAYVVYYKLVRGGHEDYLVSQPLMVTIAKAPVTYVAPAAYDTLVYKAQWQTLAKAGTTNDGTFEYSLEPQVPESWNTALPQGLAAGTYNVYYKVVGDGNHLDSIAPAPVAVSIAKAPLTATADNKGIIYGDAAPAFTVTYAGWQGEDTITALTGTIAFACEYEAGNDAGAYDIVPSGVTATNYAIDFIKGTLTVGKAESGCLAPVAFDTLVYNGAAQTLVIAGQPMGGEMQYCLDTTVADCWKTALPQAKDAGTHNVYYRVKGDKNHNDSYYNLIAVKIAKAALTATADDKTVIYGDAAPAFTVTYAGWKGTDEASVLTGTIAYTCTYAPTSNVGEYAITPSGVEAANYNITFVNGKVTVNKAELMITAEDKNVIYGDAAPTYTASYSGWKNSDDASVVSKLAYICEYAPTSNVGEYAIVPDSAVATNYNISYTAGKITVAQAALTITANDTAMIYGDKAPAFTASYSGWKNQDNESVVSNLAYTTPYQPGSPIGTYAIKPNSATALNYAITFVDGKLTVNKAKVSVSDAKVHEAKFADGNTDAEVTNNGKLNGIKLNDAIAHVTTASFSDATVGEHKTITLFYELKGDSVLLNNYYLEPTSEVYPTEGVIIEPMTPDEDYQPAEEEQVEVHEGIDVYMYGYCEGDSVGMRYHLNSGNPNQYKIDFANDSLFTDVEWTDLDVKGRDGIIYISVPVDVPTGDYKMTVYFRDSRFDWLESQAFNATFHVNLPETYVRPLFDNVMAVVDTCQCLTDIQWYWRANSSDPWKEIPGATGYYYRADGKLTGEYFIKAKMNGVETYTCGQADVETLYGEGQKAPKAIVKAYPNPVVDKTNVTIEYNGSFPEGDKNSTEWQHNLRIVNLMGIELLNTTFEGNETTVEMSMFQIGNYMISVDGITVKVMKK